MNSSILIDIDHGSCDGSYCICVHKANESDKLEIWIHGASYPSRSLVIDNGELLSEKVIRFLNADAYDFIKEIERIGWS